MTLASSRQPTVAYSDTWPGSLSPDELDLINRSQAGNLEGFNMLVEHYQHAVYRLCVRMLGEADAADATQEVFLSAFRGIRFYRGGSFVAWLLRIAKNECYDQLRARKRWSLCSLDSERDAQDVTRLQLRNWGEALDDRMLRGELAQELACQIQQLEQDQRWVVILSDVEGYSYDEIVAATGWPLGTVKSRLSRGRARLRAALWARDESLA